MGDPYALEAHIRSPRGGPFVINADSVVVTLDGQRVEPGPDGYRLDPAVTYRLRCLIDPTRHPGLLLSPPDLEIDVEGFGRPWSDRGSRHLA